MKKLFKVNDDYVVAGCYEDAIKIWLKYYNKSCYDPADENYIKSIELVKNEVIVED